MAGDVISGSYPETTHNNEDHPDKTVLSGAHSSFSRYIRDAGLSLLSSFFTAVASTIMPTTEKPRRPARESSSLPEGGNDTMNYVSYEDQQKQRHYNHDDDETRKEYQNRMTMTHGAASPPPKTNRLGCLRVIDNRRWHYFYMLLLFIDFFGNCVAVSFTSVNSFYKYGFKTRLASSGCMVIYVLEILLRLASLRGVFLRSASNVGDLVAIILMGAALALRYVTEIPS
jgi:hypothetical protein